MCLSIKEIIPPRQLLQQRSGGSRIAPLMRRNDFLLHSHCHTPSEWAVMPSILRLPPPAMPPPACLRLPVALSLKFTRTYSDEMLPTLICWDYLLHFNRIWMCKARFWGGFAGTALWRCRQKSGSFVVMCGWWLDDVFRRCGSSLCAAVKRVFSVLRRARAHCLSQWRDGSSLCLRAFPFMVAHCERFTAS